MKIIDKTPLQNTKGEVDLFARLQGTLKYGFSWYPELQAQKAVIEQLNRMIEKGFVLIRNFTLPDSEIVIPLTLIGPGGIYVIYVTHVKGFIEAKGEEWNIKSGDSTRPAGINLLSRVTRLARALQVYLKRMKIDVPAPVEPVLIAADPGAHIESMRPVARVVMSDAINLFARSLLQARPILRTDTIYNLAERIVNPRPPLEAPPQPIPSAQEPQPPISRAKAIFDASERAEPFNPADLSFAFEGEEQPLQPSQGVPPHLRETSPAVPLPQPETAPQTGRLFGMTLPQVALLAGMLVVECCVLIGFAYIFSLSR